MLNNMGIGKRILVGFGVLIILGVLSNLLTTRAVLLVNRTAGAIEKESFPFAILAEEMAFNVEAVQQFFTDVGATREPDALKEADEAAVEFRKGAGRFRELFTRNNDASSLKELAEMEADFEKFYTQGKKMAQAYVSGGTAAGNLIMRDFDKNSETIADKVKNFTTHQVKGAQGNIQGLATTLHTTQIMIWSLAACVLILSIVVSGVIGRSITRPLRSMVAMLMDIAEGEGDLTRRLKADSRDEIGEASRWFNMFMDKLHNIMSEVARNSLNLASAAAELHSASETIAVGADEVGAQVSTVASAGEEMSATSIDIAGNCLAAAKASQETNGLALDGSRVVMETVEAMNRIVARVRDSARTVEGLGERSEQIGAIVGTIEDIADQTNLLALNASIEAARAGEQGRGFAVVADEVRALAERTAKATSEIGTMIRQVQQETATAVSVMEEGVKEAEQGSAGAGKSGEALQKILDRIGGVTTQVNQIATAAEEQTATTAEISGNIGQISDIVQQSAKSAQDSAEASSEVSRLAESLRQMVGRFKLAA